uniref:Glutamine synthetase n=1 Tax=Rhodnius prolixus TaxID=13249 RepID=T1HW50_RHOPR
MEHSPNAKMNKTVLNRFLALPLPDNKVQAMYIWIDGTGEYLRSKTRTLNFVPKDVCGLFYLCPKSFKLISFKHSTTS